MAIKKAKAKKWYSIISPKIFGEKEIGKTMSDDLEKLKERRITVSAIEVSDNYSKFYLKFHLKIRRIDGEKAFTEFDGSECMRDYISRMVLRNIQRIDTVQDLKMKDGVNLRVKGLTIVSRRVKSSIVKLMRQRILEMIKGIVERSTLEDFVEKIISDEMKNRVLQEIRRVYPVRNFEFRKIEVLK